jgi:uncharacterized protein YndB with AHSA1/START domain
MKTHCPKIYTIEYIFIASPKLLFHYLSTEQGLSEWFSDKVIFKDDVFHFYWGESEQTATISSKKDHEFIRFKWIEGEENNYFEFKIKTDSVLNEITLLITDFAFEEDKEESIMVWNAAIKKLFRIFGGKFINAS